MHDYVKMIEMSTYLLYAIYIFPKIVLRTLEFSSTKYALYRSATYMQDTLFYVMHMQYIHCIQATSWQLHNHPDMQQTL